MSMDPLAKSDGLRTLEENLILAQYQSLRSEIVSILAARYQTLQITVIALGTSIAVSVQFQNPSVALAYPVLSFILARSWATDEMSIRRIAGYIAERVEKPLLLARGGLKPGEMGLDWETSMRASRKARPLDSLLSPAVGLFVISELTAVVVGLFVFFHGLYPDPRMTLIDWLLNTLLSGGNLLFLGFLVSDVICIILTALVLGVVRDNSAVHA